MTYGLQLYDDWKKRKKFVVSFGVFFFVSFMYFNFFILFLFCFVLKFVFKNGNDGDRGI